MTENADPARQPFVEPAVTETGKVPPPDAGPCPGPAYDSEDLCSWCGHELTRSEREGWNGRVCARCYRKLADAGIGGEEIFREPPVED